MGPVRIRHSSHDFGWQSSHSVDLTEWQAKMASIEIWIPWRNAHKPHSCDRSWLSPSQFLAQTLTIGYCGKNCIKSQFCGLGTQLPFKLLLPFVPPYCRHSTTYTIRCHKSMLSWAEDNWTCVSPPTAIPAERSVEPSIALKRRKMVSCCLLVFFFVMKRNHKDLASLATEQRWW